MLGRGLLLATTRPLTYRAGQGTPGSSTIAKPSGVAVGDLVLISAANDAALGSVTTSGGATWSTDSLTWGALSRIWWRFLDATDVANAWTGPISGKYQADAWIGYGATTLTVKTATTFTSAQPSLAGYTPTAASRGTIALLHQNNGTSFISDPSGFTQRENGVDIANNTALARAYLVDKLTGYVNGSVAWAFSTNPNAAGWLLDVT